MADLLIINSTKMTIERGDEQRASQVTGLDVDHILAAIEEYVRCDTTNLDGEEITVITTDETT